MRKLTSIFAVLLGIVTSAEAQTRDLKKWEVSGSASLLQAHPGSTDEGRYQDDWYTEGRYAFAIGRYWTEHLKSEVEYARSGEGSLYHQETRSFPGPADYPFYFESYHRLEQVSARMVWQFGTNNWVHPYVSGGLVGDRERQRVHIPQQYQYPSGRAGDRVLLVDEQNPAPTSEYRVGFTAATGAKIYMTRNTFFNTGVIATYSKPAATISFLAGLGIDF